nr:hypothetical protein [Chitinophagaceae bacterium]
QRISAGIVNFEQYIYCMKKITVLSGCLWLSSALFAQQAPIPLLFEQGKEYEITLQVKNTVSQQAMGQAIDFTVDATGKHVYKVTNATADNSTLNHTVKQVAFSFDGMGQQRSFDSRNEKDLNGQFGKPIQELLEKKFDMVINPTGTVLLVMPEKVTLTNTDPRVAIISNMMKEVFELVQPPAKGAASFFKVLPDTVTGKGQTWTRSTSNESGRYDAAYRLADINDSTIVVDFATNSSSISKAEFMGNPTTTNMTNKSTGKIILDRTTGIIKEKTEITDSQGSTESSFGNLPVTAKTTTTITVRKSD